MTVTLKSFVVCLLLTFLGCNDDLPSRPAKVTPQKVRSEKPLPAVDLSVADNPKDFFVYNPIGQRDPFASLLKNEAEVRQSEAPKTPLEKFDLSQFRVQAILIGKGAPRAMVNAPDGKNYILQPGLKIGKNNGVITDINETSIVVEESSIDLAGNLVKGFQSLTIPEKKTF